MKIQTMHLYHGAVLTQITEHPAFKALNKVEPLYGHYLVNHDTRIIVKYLNRPTTAWSFQFSVKELQAIRADLKLTHNVYLCLVCGQETICALNNEEFSGLIDIDADTRQSIAVDVPEGGSMHVQGDEGRLQNVVHHNSFPGKLFEEDRVVQ